MNVYMIEYYDSETDSTDYDTVSGNDEIDAMKRFIRLTHGTKVVLEIDRSHGAGENKSEVHV